LVKLVRQPHSNFKLLLKLAESLALLVEVFKLAILLFAQINLWIRILWERSQRLLQ
jgi:hypothetical protein